MYKTPDINLSLSNNFTSLKEGLNNLTPKDPNMLICVHTNSVRNTFDLLVDIEKILTS